MEETTPDLVLEAPPEAPIIGQLREQAQQSGASMIATFEVRPREPYYLVVSDRGTCVLLSDGVTVETFNRDLDDAEVADGLRATA
jgi:hypothetical protein